MQHSWFFLGLLYKKNRKKQHPAFSGTLGMDSDGYVVYMKQIKGKVRVWHGIYPHSSVWVKRASSTLVPSLPEHVKAIKAVSSLN